MSIKGIKVTAAIFVPLAALSLAAVLAGACAINPQPLPPDTNDGSFREMDAGSFTNQSSDGAAVPAADTDAGDVGGGGSNGGDAEAGTDASTDAGITDAGITDAGSD